MAKSKPTNGLRSAPRRAAQPDAAETQRPRSARTDAHTNKPVARRKSRATTASTLRTTPQLRKVRVWWPPTRDKRKTDYGGAYWPAKVTGRTDKGFRVEYDNGDIEVTHPENISPLEVPVEFGQEPARLRPGEYCEVFNGSKTDPAAWLARVRKVGRGVYTIGFPFHDSNDEVVKEARVRRARVYVEDEKAWKFIDPAQEWEDGEVTSPLELELLMSNNDIDEILKRVDEIAEKRDLEPKGSRSSLAATSKRAGDEPVKNKKDKKRRMEEDGNHNADVSSVPLASSSHPQLHNIIGPNICQASSDMRLAPTLCLMQQLAGMGVGVPGFAPVSQTAEAEMPVRRKRKKDANAPKKPKTSYVAFMEQHRAKIKESDPSMATQDVMKKLGELWSRATTEEKEACEKIAQDDRERYKKEMATYVPTPMPLQNSQGLTEQPKKPMSAYLLFSKDYRKTLDSVPFSEATKLTGQAWRVLDKDKKSNYLADAGIIKKNYEKAMKEYDAKVAMHQEQQAYLLRSLLANPQPLPSIDSGLLTQSRDSLGRPAEVSVNSILSMVDMTKARTEILKLFNLEAFYYFCDVWRESSERVGDAIRAFNCHIQGNGSRPDWRGFFVSVFGVEKMISFLKSDKEGIAGSFTEGHKSSIDNPVKENDAETGPSKKPVKPPDGNVVNSECQDTNPKDIVPDKHDQ